MQLIFDTLEFAGFKSFREPQIVHLANPGLHFVRGRNKEEPRLGSNGAGKSSLWGVLSWVLYGRTAEGLKGPDIRPWGEPIKTWGRLKITTDAEHTIYRSINPNKLTIDGDAASPEAIVALLGIDFDVFTHTILLGQGMPLFFDLQPKDKMQLFADVLNLTRWEQRSDAASTRVKELNDRLMTVTGEIMGIDRALDELTTLIASTKEKQQRWDDERAKLVKDVGKELAQINKDLAIAENKLGAAELELDGAGTEAKALQKLLQEQDTLLRDARGKLDRATMELQFHKTELATAQEKLESLSKARTCPTCHQPIKPKDLDLHRAELIKDIARLTKLVQKGVPKSLSEEWEALHARLKQTKQHLSEFQTKVDVAQDTVNFHKPQVLELRLKSKQLKSNERQEEVNPFLEQLRELKRKRGALQGQRGELDETRGKTERAIERNRYWIKGFKDVRLFIIEETLTELTLITNTMLEAIGLLDWVVQYSVEKDTKAGASQRGLNVTIFSPHNKEPVRWESWSGGEGQRLRLIGALALSEVLLNEAGIRPNLEILDEPTRHLSQEGIADLCDFLADRANDLQRSIFYVDHHVIESSRFDSVLTVSKDATGSKIRH
jgi:DNA repair exonuclease SbcCD ATPase subunit